MNDDAGAASVVVHSLTWLALTNAVGLLMSALLLAPGLGTVLSPLTYGRWGALHLNAALYGWCALPLVGLVLRLYPPPATRWSLGGVAVQAWSASVLVGGVSWLGGWTTGKPFLDWIGPARALFLLNLVFLAVVVSIGFGRQLRAAACVRDAAAARAIAGKALLWIVLIAVPALMALATRRDLYPSINTASGGPTGASLLGSTLAVVWILALAPWLLGLERAPRARSELVTFAVLALHTAAFLLLDHGDHTHREPLVLVALASLLVWGWLLPRYLHSFVWPAASRRWLAAFFAWGAVLLGSAVISFLPSVLDRIKFTDTLVGHAHLAMAGMATSFAALVLIALGRDTTLARVLDDRATFVAWHAGCVVHVAALVAAGVLEAGDPGVAFRQDPWITAFYAARAAGGALMLAASVTWLGRALREVTA